MPPRKAIPKRVTAVSGDGAASVALPESDALPPAMTMKRKQSVTDVEVILPPQKARKTVDPPQHSPLPKCRGQNEDPVGKRAKAAKAAKNKAARDTRVAEKQKKAARVEAAKQTLAEIEADESFARMEEEEHHIQRLSDLEAGVSDEDGNTTNGGDTSMDDGDGTSNSEHLGSQKDRRAKKKGKVGLRSEVREKKDKIKTNRRAGKNQDIPLASGLSTAWVELQARTKREAKVAGKQRTNHAIDDAVALSTRPDYPPSPDKFDRNAVDHALANASDSENETVAKRKNTRVARRGVETSDHHSDESDSESSVAPPVRAIAKKSRAPSSGKQKSIPARAPAGQRASKPTKRAQRNSDADDTGSDAGSAPSTRKSARDVIMPRGGNTVNLLPSIIASSKATYFATLLNALYASEEPFDEFVKTSRQFLTISRKAFREIWPVLNVLMETDHLLFNLGYQRVLEKRGKIYDAVKVAIEQHIASQQYSKSDVVAWVKWFLQTNGSPLFYQVPTPQDGPWNRNTPGYTKPQGFLRSRFLIGLGSQFIHDASLSAIDFGYPQGLFVLILTACEKVVREYKSGSFTPSGNFCGKFCNTWARGYNRNFNNRKDEWWTTILACYNAARSDSDSLSEEIDETRDTLPRTSSPSS